MLTFSPQDVLDEILDLIESVSEGFPTYSFLVAERIQSFQNKFFLLKTWIFVISKLCIPYLV